MEKRFRKQRLKISAQETLSMKINLLAHFLYNAISPMRNVKRVYHQTLLKSLGLNHPAACRGIIH
jgi:hypothetical protein